MKTTLPMKVIDVDKEGDMSKKEFTMFLNQVIGKKPFVLFVHAPWCGHCQHVKPLMNKALRGLNKSSHFALVKVSDVVVQHVQSSHQGHLFAQLLKDTVQGYPTIIAVDPLKKNELRVKFFDKERTAENLKKFLTRHE